MTAREFERVVGESRDRLFGYALYFLGIREEAEDVVQDVYLRLWQHRQELDGSRVNGWLVSVSRNLCRDRLRRRKVRSSVNVDTEALSEIAGDGRLPDAGASAALFEEALKGALSRLPDPQKSIVILREIQGMSYREIGDALDLPMTSVKVYLHRGRRALRNELTKVLQREAV